MAQQSTVQPCERVWADELTSASPQTNGYGLNHTMLQIKDPVRSLKFYTEFLGMSLIFQLNTGPCSVYYLGYPSSQDKVPLDIAKGMSSKAGLLELVHIHERSSSDSEGAGVASFGHLGFTVPDVDQIVRRAREHGYEVLKDKTDTSGLAMDLPAKSNNAFHDNFLAAYTQIAFLRDPDG